MVKQVSRQAGAPGRHSRILAAAIEIRPLVQTGGMTGRERSWCSPGRPCCASSFTTTGRSEGNGGESSLTLPPPAGSLQMRAAGVCVCEEKYILSLLRFPPPPPQPVAAVTGRWASYGVRFFGRARSGSGWHWTSCEGTGIWVRSKGTGLATSWKSDR